MCCENADCGHLCLDPSHNPFKSSLALFPLEYTDDVDSTCDVEILLVTARLFPQLQCVFQRDKARASALEHLWQSTSSSQL